ncbi:Uncharacterised protein [Klebsiella pneumoniae]|nr:Uncharacterised protein [Klebsiella pneumoniae]
MYHRMRRSKNLGEFLIVVSLIFIVIALMISGMHILNNSLQIFAIQHHHGKAQRAQPFMLAQLVGAWRLAG